MDMKRSLYVHITKFLRCEMTNLGYNSEVLEHLAVACDCLELAFNIKEDEIISSNNDLLMMLKENNSATDPKPIRNAYENQKLSDACKTEGNKMMELGCFEKAIECYTDGIAYCKTSAVCFCNRAAAFAKLNLYNRAIEDCKEAIKLNSRYSKAYARMGLYCSKLGQLSKAIYCYKMALDIDPNNESYMRNLAAAKMKFSRVGIKSSLSKPNSLMDLNNNQRAIRSTSASSTDECYYSSTESLDEELNSRLFDKLAAELLLDSRELSPEECSSMLKSQEMQELCLEFLNRLRLVDASFVDHVGHDLHAQLRINSNRLPVNSLNSHRKNLRVTFKS